MRATPAIVQSADGKLPLASRSARRRGVVAPMMAIMLLGLVGIAAVAIDGGLLLSDRRNVQATADAAAVAAAIDLFNNYSTYGGVDTPGTALKSAEGVATDNGFADGKNGVTVSVNIPPSSGTFKGSNGYAEVIITKNQSRFFSNLFGSGTIPVKARAVARGVVGSSGIGLLVLNPTASGALTLTGNATVNVLGSVIVNSSNASAAQATGNAGVTGTEFDVTGNYNTTGNAYISAPTTKTGATATADPLSGIPEPSTSGLTVQSTSTAKPSSGQTLLPGIYQGGISLSSTTSITLNSGIFYLQGGGLQMSGQSSITGSNVMIFNGPDLSGNVGNISINGGATLTLTPPASGTYQGITIFEERSSTASISLSGGSGWNLTGTIYAPSAEVDVTGGSSSPMGSQYIVNTLTITGTGALGSIDPSKGAGTRLLGLVE